LEMSGFEWVSPERKVLRISAGGQSGSHPLRAVICTNVLNPLTFGDNPGGGARLDIGPLLRASMEPASMPLSGLASEDVRGREPPSAFVNVGFINVQFVNGSGTAVSEITAQLNFPDERSLVGFGEGYLEVVSLPLKESLAYSNALTALRKSGERLQRKRGVVLVDDWSDEAMLASRDGWIWPATPDTIELQWQHLGSRWRGSYPIVARAAFLPGAWSSLSISWSQQIPTGSS